MIVNAAVFTCSICSEPSTDICAYCTKDACANHRCIRCKRCSDCCECEFPLSAEEPMIEQIAEETPAEEPAFPPVQAAEQHVEPHPMAFAPLEESQPVTEALDVPVEPAPDQNQHEF